MSMLCVYAMKTDFATMADKNITLYIETTKWQGKVCTIINVWVTDIHVNECVCVCLYTSACVCVCVLSLIYG